MIIQFITSKRFKAIFNFGVYVIFFGFLLSSSGCVNTSRFSYKKEYNEEINDYEIIKIITKDGKLHNVEGLNAKFYKKYGDKDNVIAYGKTDSTLIDDNGRAAYKLRHTLNIIPITDVLEVYVEKEELKVANTILIVLGIAVLTIVAILLIALATKQSCPFFYSFDGSKYIFDAESFGGAIAEGLTRTDYSRMDYLKASDGLYKIMIRNEADESQHIDELKLYALDHPKNTEVIPDYNGNYTAFSKSIEPVKVTDENSNDVTAFFKSRDGIYWQSYMEMDSSILKSNLRHKLTFDFRKPGGVKKAKLLINAGSTLWGSKMLKEMLIMRGDKIDDWYSEINKHGTVYKMMNAWLEREELYTMRLYMKQGEEYTETNKITSGGPFTIEDRIIDLDLSNVQEEDFSLQINPPKGFWKIDYMGIVYDCGSDYKLTEVPMVSAVDYKGSDLKKELSSIDKFYYDMPTNNDTAYVNFSAIPLKEGYTRTLWMKSTGYYEIHLKKNQPYNSEFFEKILNPGYIVQFSFQKYLENVLENFSKN